MDLGTLPPADEWTEASGLLVVPAGAISIQLAHIIDSPGRLDLDAASLEIATTDDPEWDPTAVVGIDDSGGNTGADTGTPTPPAGYVPNGSVELADGTAAANPAGWTPAVGGNAAATFTVVSGATDGELAIRVDVLAANGGDAKWVSPALVLAPATGTWTGRSYYRSNKATRLMVQVERANGAVLFLELDQVLPSDDWAIAEGTFVLPADAVDVRMMHVIDSAGWLVTDAYDVVEGIQLIVPPDGATDEPGGGTDGSTDAAPTPGAVVPAADRPLVSIAMDDGWVSAYKVGIPMMEERGYLGTHYIHAGYMDRVGFGDDHVTSVQVLKLAAAGHEIGSHALGHAILTELSSADLADTIVRSKQILEDLLGVEVSGFAPPGGATDAEVTALIEANYDYTRTIEDGLNFPPYDLRHVKVRIISNLTTLAEVKEWLAEARDLQGWLVLLLHRFEPAATADTIITVDMWTSVLDAMEAVNADVRPVGEVLGTWSAEVGSNPIGYDSLVGDSDDDSELIIPIYGGGDQPAVTDSGYVGHLMANDPNGDEGSASAGSKASSGGCTGSPGERSGLVLLLGLTFLALLGRRRRLHPDRGAAR